MGRKSPPQTWVDTTRDIRYRSTRSRVPATECEGRSQALTCQSVFATLETRHSLSGIGLQRCKLMRHTSELHSTYQGGLRAASGGVIALLVEVWNFSKRTRFLLPNKVPDTKLQTVPMRADGSVRTSQLRRAGIMSNIVKGRD